MPSFRAGCVPVDGFWNAFFTHFKHFAAWPVRAFLMSLDLSDVKRLAILAQLDLTADQADHTLVKLNGIFALVEQMRAVDTTGVTPLSHPIAALRPELALRLRDDQVTESSQRAHYQQCAPAIEDGLYLVPKVIE